ncbi:hypothetical protein A2U01_0103503, partial [Trifolium medium]|nr:hypothetical protein [Trifolium medium]
MGKIEEGVDSEVWRKETRKPIRGIVDVETNGKCGGVCGSIRAVVVASWASPRGTVSWIL